MSGRDLSWMAEREWLAEFVRAAEGHPALTSYEARFVQNIRIKWVGGLRQRRVSNKQAAVIREIWAKVEIEPRDAAEAALNRKPLVAGLPDYWMDATDNVLRAAGETWLLGGELDGEEIAALRAYLCQWIEAPGWDYRAEDISELREAVSKLPDQDAIRDWLHRASDAGIEPL